jgi:hypothetical protein
VERLIRGSRRFGRRLAVVLLGLAIIVTADVINVLLQYAFRSGTWIPPIPITLVWVAVAAYITIRWRSPGLALCLALPFLAFSIFSLVINGRPSGFGERVAFNFEVSAAIQSLITTGFGVILGVLWNRRAPNVPAMSNP